MPHRPLLTITRKADADLSAKARFVVKATAANGCALVAASTDQPLGIIYNKPRPTVGTAVGIIIAGTAECVAGAAIAVNAPLMADANGRVITAAGVSVNPLVGVALQAAAALGDVIEVRLTLAGKFV